MLVKHQFKGQNVQSPQSIFANGKEVKGDDDSAIKEHHLF